MGRVAKAHTDALFEGALFGHAEEGPTYLASSRAAAIHGAEFVIDGGTVRTV